MKKLVFLFILAAALGVQVSFAQESQPAPKQPSSFAGTDSPEDSYDLHVLAIRFQMSCVAVPERMPANGLVNASAFRRGPNVPA